MRFLYGGLPAGGGGSVAAAFDPVHADYAAWQRGWLGAGELLPAEPVLAGQLEWRTDPAGVTGRPAATRSSKTWPGR